MLAALLNNQTVVVAASWANYHRTILATARALIADGHFGPAITLAHTAAEVSTERVFAACFRARGIADLGTIVMETMRSSNLTNDRVRTLYGALTGDRVVDQPFWQAFVESRKFRDPFVHRAAPVTRDQAEAGCTAVDRLLDHLERILEQAEQQAVQQAAQQPNA